MFFITDINNPSASARARQEFGARLSLFWTDGVFDRGVLQRFSAPDSSPALTESPFVGRALDGEAASRPSAKAGEVDSITPIPGPRRHSNAAMMLTTGSASPQIGRAHV